MSETLTRTISGVIYIAILLGATIYSQLSFQILFGLFMVMALFEFSKLLKLPSLLSVCSGIIAVVFITGLNHLFRHAFDFVNLLAVAVLLYLSYTLFFGRKKPAYRNVPKYVLLLCYAVIPFFSLLKLPYIAGEYTYQIIIGLFILIWTNDTFAYLIGKSIGRRKLLEKVSPKKTIEGFLGGLFFAIIASFVIHRYFTFFSLQIWISSAIFVSVFGTIGDLVESKFKREAGVKDSGTIMPGHGGILDRLDSIIFVVPFLYLIFQTF